MATNPNDRPSFMELASGSTGEAVACPRCGCADFRVQRTWRVKSGERHSSLICRHCGDYEFNAVVEKIIRPI